MKSARHMPLTTLLTILIGMSTELTVAADVRPNVVFIMTDDQGPWALGAAGDPNAVTPNLNRLRTEGVMLTRCYTPTPGCSPARASVLTSRYGSELGITDYLPGDNVEAPGLSPRIPTWPGLLSQAGYVTGLVGKYHCGQRPEAHQTRDWKLVRFLRSRRPDEFYDRRRDPEENRNLATSDDPAVQQAIAQLRTR